MPEKKKVEVTAIWLRRRGDQVEVLVEIDNDFHLAISEHWEGNFSHIAEGRGYSNWPTDPIDDENLTPKEKAEGERIRKVMLDACDRFKKRELGTVPENCKCKIGSITVPDGLGFSVLDRSECPIHSADTIRRTDLPATN
jgi:hypothetical protein